jgi:hypothetical protein
VVEEHLAHSARASCDDSVHNPPEARTVVGGEVVGTRKLYQTTVERADDIARLEHLFVDAWLTGSDIPGIRTGDDA